MKKKVLAIIALACILITVLVACGNATINNSSFDSFNKNDVLTDWKSYQDNGDKSTKTMTFEKLSAGGSDESATLVTDKYVKFEVTNTYGTIGLKQKVTLDKNANYKLSFSLNIETTVTSSKDGFGAFVGFEEDVSFLSGSFKDKTGGWVRKEIYFNVKDSGDYTLMLGIGREETSGARGKASFDNISIDIADSIPSGIATATVAGSKAYTFGGTVTYVVIFALLSIAVVLFGYLLMLRTRYNNKFGIENKSKWTSPFMIFVYILTGAFIIRFLIVALSGGMSSEMTELGNIALKINDKGINNLYASGSTTTQPVGVLYLLGLAGAIGKAANLSAMSQGMSILIRMPMILADLAVCYMLFAIVSKYKSQQDGVFVAGIYALLPVVFTASAVWGRYLTIPLAFILAMLYFMIEKKYIGVSAMFLCALLFNHWMIILAPFAVLYALYFFVKDKRASARISIVASAIAAVILFWLIALPFTINYVEDGNFWFAFKKMFAAFETNVLISNDVFNLYAVFGLGRASATLITKVITGIIMCALLGIGVWFYLTRRNKLDLILFAAMSLILFSVFGIGAQIDILIIGVLLLLPYAVIRNDRRIMRGFNYMSFMTFINVGGILINSSVFSNENNYAAFTANNWLYILGSILTVIGTVYLCYLTYSIVFTNNKHEFRPIDSIKSYFTEFADDVTQILLKHKK